ncbi:Arc family DNA-binding protein [Acetobacter okinawensis]|uniref:Arc family DNA-binding protein n=1 Tax=Acetobacter okinawensis TaxID=1076594 RepID=UPI0039EB0FE4
MNKSHLRLRLPVHIKEWVQKSAEKNKRSQNAEVLFWLEQASNGDAGEKFGDCPSIPSTTTNGQIRHDEQ